MNIDVPTGALVEPGRDVAWRVALLCFVLVTQSACQGSYESATRADLEEVQRAVTSGEERVKSELKLDGSLNDYLAFALANNPEIRASFERWKAASLSVSRARRLPEPVIKYSYFIRSVETRVGPQQHRLSLAQSFPWPTQLSAGADAASAAARAAQRSFDAEVLAVRLQVAQAYWQLWLLHEEHRLKAEHDIVLETLAGTVRGRVRTGAASLADLNQVELGIARHHDHHGEHMEQQKVATAELLRAIGAEERRGRLPIRGTPIEGLPSRSEEALRQAATQNPRVQSAELMASASDSMTKVEAAARAPSLHTGLDWIVTGDAPAPVQDSGQDAVAVTAGLSIPLWGRSYKDAVGAAEARAAAYRAERDAHLQSVDAELEKSMAAVRDAQRRIELYRHTLIPQAETSFRSVLGSYQTGRSDVAAALLAQRDLLELQLELARSRAQHALAWAELERVVGQPIEVDERGAQP